MAANALGRADGPMGDYVRRFKGRLGKAEGIVAGAPTNSPGSSRRLLKNWGMSRESNLGRMARRERRAYPLRSVRSEQHRQTPQCALALRVAPIFELRGVARQSQTPAGMLPSSRLAQLNNRKQRDMSQFFNSLLGHDRFRPALR